jgi:hypothetical protein
VWGKNTSAATAAFVVANSASTTNFVIFNDGNATLAGTLTQSSDQRLKQNIQTMDATSTLDLITQLNPVTFNWRNPDQATTTQIGFIAQEVQRVFPTLVATTSATALTPDGTLGVNYIGFVAPIISALQELAAQVKHLADLVQTKKVQTDQLCVGDTCVTQDQLKALLQNAGAQSAAASSGSSSSSSASTTPDTTAPTVSLTGANPATVSVGDTYTDLGATVTDNVDNNLGFTVSVDGGAATTLDAMVLDTSVAGTHSVVFSATDQAGNTGTATRTVNVQ